MPSEFKRALALSVAVFSRFALWPGGFANRFASADAQEDPAFWPYNELSGLKSTMVGQKQQGGLFLCTFWQMLSQNVRQRVKLYVVPRGIIHTGLDKLSISGDESKVTHDISWPSSLFNSLSCSDGRTHGKADARGAFAALTYWASILMLMSMVL